MDFFPYDPYLAAGIRAAEAELEERLNRQERAARAQQIENERAERAAEEQYKRNLEFLRPKVGPAWEDPVAKKQQAVSVSGQTASVSDLIQRVQEYCGLITHMTVSMFDHAAHRATMMALVKEARQDLARRRGLDPTRLATNDELHVKRYREVLYEQDKITRDLVPKYEREAKHRVRVLAPPPMNGSPWREGKRAPVGWKPSQEVLDASQYRESFPRIHDYFPPRAPGFVPKVVVKKDDEK